MAFSPFRRGRKYKPPSSPKMPSRIFRHKGRVDYRKSESPMSHKALMAWWKWKQHQYAPRDLFGLNTRALDAVREPTDAELKAIEAEGI